MRVYVDDEPVDLAPGATVYHALLRARPARDSQDLPRVFDPWGNEVGLDGEVSEGDRLFTR